MLIVSVILFVVNGYVYFWCAEHVHILAIVYIVSCYIQCLSQCTVMGGKLGRDTCLKNFFVLPAQTICSVAVSFLSLFSPLGKLADRAIYFTFRNFFSFLLGAKLSQYLLDRFSRSFHQMEGICVNFLDQVHFFQLLKRRCHGNQFCVVSKTQTTCDFCNFYTK